MVGSSNRALGRSAGQAGRGTGAWGAAGRGAARPGREFSRGIPAEPGTTMRWDGALPANHRANSRAAAVLPCARGSLGGRRLACPRAARWEGSHAAKPGEIEICCPTAARLPGARSWTRVHALRGILARQGSVVASWRRRGGRQVGPYYRVAYRLDGRWRSMYLGRSEGLAEQVRATLREFRQPLADWRHLDRARKLARKAFRAHKVVWARDLARVGLYLKGNEIRGLRKLKHPQAGRRRMLPGRPWRVPGIHLSRKAPARHRTPAVAPTRGPVPGAGSSMAQGTVDRGSCGNRPTPSESKPSPPSQRGAADRRFADASRAPTG